MRFFICTTAGGDPKGEPYVLNASEWVESHLISRGQAKDMGVLDGGKVIMQVAWGELGLEGRMLKGFEPRYEDEGEGDEGSAALKKVSKKEKKSRAEKRERNLKNGGGGGRR